MPNSNALTVAVSQGRMFWYSATGISSLAKSSILSIAMAQISAQSTAAPKFQACARGLVAAIDGAISSARAGKTGMI